MERAGKDRCGSATQRITAQAKWTFMVYMAGDNNLDGAALRDIAEMASMFVNSAPAPGSTDGKDRGSIGRWRRISFPALWRRRAASVA